MPSPATLRVLGYAYVGVSVLLWPLTTLISTAFALKLKVPPWPAAAWPRPAAANRR
jgi:hypothetical protein